MDVFPEEKMAPNIVKPSHRNGFLDHATPYRDFHHFVQKMKPWLDKEIANNPHAHVEIPRSPYELWFNTLRKIEAEYNFGIDTTNVWNGRPTLGTFPSHVMVKQSKQDREQKNNR